MNNFSISIIPFSKTRRITEQIRKFIFKQNKRHTLNTWKLNKSSMNLTQFNYAY